MTFLREQMGEEELRNLLQMLSLEAGQWLGGVGGEVAGWRAAMVAEWWCICGWRAELAASPSFCPACLKPLAGTYQTLPSPAATPAPHASGTDGGGIDVNRLMELADAAEEEQDKEAQQA
jgi:hypothetical protein